MNTHKIWTTLLIIWISSSHLHAQTELDVELGVSGGSEYNIFKSPEVLLDRTTMEAFPEDSIIYSDLFIDSEYDIEYQKSMDRSTFEIGSDLWYRNYIEFTTLNQARLGVNTLYQFFITEKLSVAGEYLFRWSDRIGTSVTGDLLMRSFKYLGHTGRIFMEYQSGENLEMKLVGDYEFKDYYAENTRDPLDHSNLDLSYQVDYEINNDHDFGLELGWRDRNYFEYHSLDSLGKYYDTSPLRNFRYLSAEFDYNWSPIRGLRINPGVEVIRRIDTYQNYYSYEGIGANLRLRYYWDNFYISLYGDYKQVTYDIRPAFTSLDEDPMLVYGYYDLNFTFRYDLSDQWEVYIVFETNNRSSNTDLEYFKTRRPYNNYITMLGLSYSLPDMSW